jgi:tetratricopeptide (TPR) repeat protein
MAENNTKPKEQLKALIERIENGDIDPVCGGNQLFSFGHCLDTKGLQEEADQLYLQAIELLEEIANKTDDSFDVLEVAETALSSGKKLFQLNRFANARIAFDRAVEILDALVLLDASFVLVEKLAIAVTWNARSTRKSGDHVLAVMMYERAISILKTLKELNRSHNKKGELILLIGSNLLGLAKSVKETGAEGLAIELAEEAYSILSPAVNRLSYRNRNSYYN